jgi:hypothetical protein
MFLQRLYGNCDRDREHVPTISESEDTKVRPIYDTALSDSRRNKVPVRMKLFK